MKLPFRPIALGLALLAGSFLALPLAGARAEDEELDEVSRQVKEQMEKIIQLMRENEEALLQLSAGQSGATRPVDVVPPDLPPGQNGNAGGSEGGAAGGPEGAGGTPESGPGTPEGRKAAEALGELVKRQRGASGKIPGELEELVRMIPT